jgi:hypothetical protein
MSKSALSWGVVAAGIILGISFLALVAPVWVYTAALNDNQWEKIAVYALMGSTLPASILAIYQRLMAGVWLTLVGAYATVVMGWGAYQLVLARAQRVDYTEVLGDSGVAFLVAAIGIFFCITWILHWPDLSTGAVGAD